MSSRFTLMRNSVSERFTVALIGAFHVPELTFGTTLGNLGYERITFPNPVFHGDTLKGRTRILNKRESKSRDDSGIVWFEHIGVNQRDQVVCEMVRVGLMAKRPRDLGEAVSGSAS
jgi:acyl dehydratase